ncbi:unnamed protein product, partial [Prorocentrum cordatum]
AAGRPRDAPRRGRTPATGWAGGLLCSASALGAGAVECWPSQELRRRCCGAAVMRGPSAVLRRGCGAPALGAVWDACCLGASAEPGGGVRQHWRRRAERLAAEALRAAAPARNASRLEVDGGSEGWLRARAALLQSALAARPASGGLARGAAALHASVADQLWMSVSRGTALAWASAQRGELAPSAARASPPAAAAGGEVHVAMVASVGSPSFGQKAIAGIRSALRSSLASDQSAST